MRSQSVLSKSFAISLLFHVGLLGGLVLFVSRSPVVSDAPLRVRILGSPGPSVEQAPAPAPLDKPVVSSVEPPAVSRVEPPVARRGPVEAPPRAKQPDGPQIQTERLPPRPVPVPDKPAVAPPLPPPPAPAPQVATRSEPEASVPTPMPAPTPPEVSRGTLRGTSEEPPAATAQPPERGSLILGGPPASAPARPPTSSGPTGRGSSLPSLRDQLASIGKDVLRDSGEAKRTINLDDRAPDLLPYLAKLKGRIQAIWGYPRPAREMGLTGELLLVFTLNNTGTLTNLRMEYSSGFPILDEEAIRAVRAAAPYDPFPPDMNETALNIRASFHYYLDPRPFRRN